MIKKGDVVSYNRYQMGNEVVQGFIVLDDLGEECIIEQICSSFLKLQMLVNKEDLEYLF